MKNTSLKKTTLVKKFTIVSDIMLNLFVRGGTEMMLSEKPDFAGATWQSYETSMKWTFTTQGKIKIYAKFRDEANNESAVASTEVIFDKLEGFEEDGLLTFNEFGLKVLPAGKAFIRNICMAFDKHLNQANSPQKLFSKTI